MANKKLNFVSSAFKFKPTSCSLQLVGQRLTIVQVLKGNLVLVELFTKSNSLNKIDLLVVIYHR